MTELNGSQGERKGTIARKQEKDGLSTQEKQQKEYNDRKGK